MSDLLHLDRPNLVSTETWRARLAHVEELHRIVTTRQPTSADGTDLFEIAVDRGCLLAWLGSPSGLGATFQAAAAAAAAATLAQTAESGTILFTPPGGASRRIPPGPARLNPALWRDALSLALLVRDEEALAVLTAPATIDSVQLPAHQADAFWPAYCRAFAAVANAEPDADHQFQRATALLANSQIIAPDVREEIDRPVLELARLLHSGTTRGWTVAVREAIAAHRRHFSREENHGEPRGALPLAILGLCALAHDRGIVTAITSEYFPAELVATGAPPTSSYLTLALAPRLITRAEEAIWFLDLAGFPRNRRSHRLLETPAGLVARYEASGAKHLPHATVDFLYPDDLPAGATPPPPALDPGELVWLAERFATTAGEKRLSEREQRAWLSEAVECIETVLPRIHTSVTAVQANAFTSRLGRELFAAEPGRFQRARLEAYRDALRRQVDNARPHSAPSGPIEETVDAREAALAFVDLIRAQAMPLLEALGRPGAAEIVPQLRPRPDDFAKVFAAPVVDAARRAYETIWSGSLDMTAPAANQTEVICHVAPAGMFASDNELSRHFPGGYSAIAGALNPQRVWIAWKYVAPGQTTGLAFDGLVWCDDHWAWFPKPYQALAPIPPAR